VTRRSQLFPAHALPGRAFKDLRAKRAAARSRGGCR
jgi:hypothetical protein